MNNKLYQAASSQLRSRALSALAAIEQLLNDRALYSADSDATEEIIKHALELVQCEGAIHSLQTYFQSPAPPPPQAAPPPKPAQPTEEPLVVTPEISSTYKQSLEKAQIIAQAAQKREEEQQDD